MNSIELGNPEGLAVNYIEDSNRRSRVARLLERCNPHGVIEGIQTLSQKAALINVRDYFIRGFGIAAVVAASHLPIFDGGAASRSSSPDSGAGIAWADGCPNLPWGNGKYQTFPRLVDGAGNIIALNEIDNGKLGPDVDRIVGIDFEGDIPTGFKVIHRPDGSVSETRVVMVIRDLETVQFRPALGGDRFDAWQVSKFGGDVCLDASARLHAENTARQHQKVVYTGDLGLAQREWPNERDFFHKIIRAQRPSQLGIPESNFVNPRRFQ